MSSLIDIEKYCFEIKVCFNFQNIRIDEWIGDGFCDDSNNKDACAYDGGDCCGIDVQKRFCYDCACKGMYSMISNVEIRKYSHYSFLVFTCKNNADCNNQGYCHVGECICQPNYQYEEDCSQFGCK